MPHRRQPVLSPGVRVAVAVLALLVLATGAMSWFNIHRLAEDSEWVNHTHQVLAAAASVAEARQRLAVADRESAASAGAHPEVDAAGRVLMAELARLQALTRDNPAQQARVAALREQAAARADLDPALHEIEAEEHRLLAERDRQFSGTYNTMVATSFAAVLLGLAALASLVWELRRHIQARSLVVEQDQRLREALGELTAQDQRKNEFLAVLAHELRNPLAPLRTGIEILNRVGSAEATAARTRGMMERQLNHMVRLIDELLDVSRISRGKIELHREPVRLADVLQQAVETNRPMLESLGHKAELPPAEQLAGLWVDGDPVRLAQVFGNLLNNAARYSEPGGRIQVSVQAEAGRLQVTVRDQGLGIPPDMLERVFDMFTQVQRPGEPGRGGLGIGLSLVRSLVALHGGEVSAHSEGLGRGSEFVVVLPRIPAPATAQAGPPAPEPAAAGLSVLVADDNRDAAESVASFLELLGHRPQVVHDGQEAVEAVQARRPDVVLLDIGMPRMDGLEACRRIRGLRGGASLRIAAMTGWGQEEDIRRSIEAGFDEHLVKPVQPGALEALLARWAQGQPEALQRQAARAAP